MSYRSANCPSPAQKSKLLICDLFLLRIDGSYLITGEILNIRICLVKVIRPLVIIVPLVVMLSIIIIKVIKHRQGHPPSCHHRPSSSHDFHHHH